MKVNKRNGLPRRILSGLLVLVWIFSFATLGALADTTPTMQYQDLNVTVFIGDKPFTNPMTITGVGDLNGITYTIEADTNVATIAGNVVTIGNTAGSATITATYRVDNDTYTGIYYLTVKEAIRYADNEIYKVVGDTAFINPLTVEKANPTSITYTINNDVASINVKTGEVTVTKAGTATITATAQYADDTEASAFYKLKVTEGKLSFASPTITKKVGDAPFSNELTKDNVTGNIVYSTSDDTVAIVDTNGLVTIKAAGTATITAKATTGEEAFYTLTVEATPVSTLRFSQTIVYKVDGDTAFINPLTIEHYNGNVTYSTDADTVATVGTDGRVTIKGAGKATITAKAGTEDDSPKASYTLTVFQKSYYISDGSDATLKVYVSLQDRVEISEGKTYVVIAGFYNNDGKLNKAETGMVPASSETSTSNNLAITFDQAAKALTFEVKNPGEFGNCYVYIADGNTYTPLCDKILIKAKS